MAVLTKEEANIRIYDSIEIMGHKGLWSNIRVLEKDLPAGLYTYDVREGDNDEWFGTLEKSVWVNHFGTVIVREPIDLGKDGYIELEGDTEPDFIGEGKSLREFVEENK